MVSFTIVTGLLLLMMLLFFVALEVTVERHFYKVSKRIAQPFP